jgi:hypothetical protein
VLFRSVGCFRRSDKPARFNHSQGFVRHKMNRWRRKRSRNPSQKQLTG